MSVELDGDFIFLKGACTADDAEMLASLLVQQRSRCIDLEKCISLHGAVLQVLIAFRPSVGKTPKDPRLSDLISHAIAAE
ncbi:MAG: hypothetical protein JWN07_2020 [Hyphomicrobiales bacterium]|nr:hypothetical protein [Hyphomicrobiales bacterium]